MDKSMSGQAVHAQSVIPVSGQTNGIRVLATIMGNITGEARTARDRIVGRDVPYLKHRQATHPQYLVVWGAKRDSILIGR